MQEEAAVFACAWVLTGLDFARCLCDRTAKSPFVANAFALEERHPMTDIVIVSAARTPIGSFLGAFAATPAHELGRTAISAALQRAKVDAGEVSEVVLG